jgi:multiple sugar transport system ATP-binding protein
MSQSPATTLASESPGQGASAPGGSLLGHYKPAGVSLEHVTKRFGSVVAVDDLSLEVEPGEFLVLLGPSGCGKSTVLRLVAGLEEPTEGTVRIGGEVVNDVDPKDRDVAMVFQSYALYPHLSVRKNIEFPLRARRIPAHEREALVDNVARDLQLDKLLERKPGQLSGGQRQRVALARAIVRRPKVFLMDEPLSNLDAQLRAEMRVELAELQARLGITVIYVTHDQTEATTLGHRMAVLHDGVLQQLDQPAVVTRHPANAFVAGFVGNPPMNILKAQVVSQGGAGGALAVVFPGAGSPVSLGSEGSAAALPPAVPTPSPQVGSQRPLPALRDGEEVLVGLAPDALTPAEAGELMATVSLVELLGRERHVVCKLPGGQRVVAELASSPRNGSSLAQEELHAGQRIRLSVDKSQMHFFDVATGARLGP